jgi:predicted mannosyl-3-phosphoglycerate phosphatase (HAD superfamily)
MKDPYFDTDRCVERLVGWFHKHGNLVVAFDYDDTLFDFHKKGYRYPSMVKLLRQCSRMGFTMILFSSQSTPEEFEEIKKNLAEYDIRVDYINESPVDKKSIKPYFNILLDDKAGLGQAYNILSRTIATITRH